VVALLVRSEYRISQSYRTDECFFFQCLDSGGNKNRLTAPRMVDTSSCQSLMMFKYVMEFEDLVNASPRRVSPGPRVRVSKRRIEPLREPVYTEPWLASQVGRYELFTILDGLPPPDATQRHHYVSLSA
jgi:hypothetical protein